MPENPMPPLSSPPMDDDSGDELRDLVSAAQNTDVRLISSVRIRTKSNEEIIREELRVSAQNYLNVWRSGVALIPSLLLAIAFLRREVLEQMQKFDETITAIPLDRYILGTLFLFLVAYIFSKLCVDLAARYKWYSDQLVKQCDNPIGLPYMTERQQRSSLFRRVFYVFPAFDLFVRATLEMERHGYFTEFAFMAIIIIAIYGLTLRSSGTRLRRAP